MKNVVFLFYFLISVLSIGCASGPKSSDEKPPENFTVKELKSGYEFYIAEGHIYIGPQPTAEDLEAFKTQHDVSTVVNLRSPRENRRIGFDPKEITEKNGMVYHSEPLMKKKQPQDKAITNIKKAFVANGGKNILVFCSSGNRAAAWYAIKRAQETKMSTQEAIDIAKQVGLNNRRLSREISSYFEKNGITTQSELLEKPQPKELTEENLDLPADALTNETEPSDIPLLDENAPDLEEPL